MTDLKPLLELREKIKSKKPNFIRQDYQRRKRLGRKLRWKKPKGIHSKIRHKFKGHRKMPSPGHKSPRKVKGLHASGLRIVNISSTDSLKKIKRESEGIIISKSIGNKKRLEILKMAKELNIAVLNLNADEHIKKIEDFVNSKKKIEIKETKKEKAKGKEKAKAEIKEISGDAEIQLLDAESASGKEAKEKEPKKKEQKERLPEKLSDEQKKEAEKKEKPPEKVIEEEKKEEEKKKAEKKEKDEILTKRI